MDAQKVDNWLAHLGRSLLAPRCLLCRECGTGGLDLCSPCAASLPWNRPACTRCALPLADAGVCGRCLQRDSPLQLTHAALVYRRPLDWLLPRFKFHGDLAAGRLLSRLMLDASGPIDREAVLVPLPLHRSRLRSRGYDQALELARPLARGLHMPLDAALLQRRRDTRPQSELAAGQRRSNLRQAFEVMPGRPPPHVVLVDDVMTTGATLEAAARALRRAGVARVDAWVCARAP